MRKIVTVLSAAAVIATLLPAAASAGERHRDRSANYHRYERVAYAGDRAYAADRVYAADRAYVRQPVYAAAGLPADPLLYPVGGAIIGAIIGAAVCPPCAIAGSALTSGGGALVGAGIGAIGGTVVGVAVTQPRIVRY